MDGTTKSGTGSRSTRTSETQDRNSISGRFPFAIMHFPRTIPLVSLLVIVIAAAGIGAAQNSPVVIKVEPPSWWAGHSINPVRILIRGRNLQSASVRALCTGIRTRAARVNEAGTYIFVDLLVAPQAKPGACRLEVTNANGSTDATFAVLKPVPRAGRFQGFSPNDVIYLIMIDRFSDGDLANNDPPQSRGLFNRGNKFYYHGGD